MSGDDSIHLVILVHGIRDLARWQSGVGDALKAEGFDVAHTSYGRFNLFKFLIPTDIFRSGAAEEIWTDIRSAKLEAERKHPGKRIDVSIVAHSFGTYIVTRIVKKEFDLDLKRIILCGAVVHYRFPFQEIQHRFDPPLINEVGTRDPWPAMADFLTFGYGSAGTTGFNRPFVTDRFHNKAGHGYFLNADFARRFWVPFLRDGTIVPGSPDAENPPFWVRLLLTFKIKYLLFLLLVLLVALFGLKWMYPADPVSLRMGGNFAYWSSFEPFARNAQSPCPLPFGLCSVPGLAQLVMERRFIKLNVEGGALQDVVSCGDGFTFPPRDAPTSRDPVSLLEYMGEKYDQCVAVDIDERNNMSVRLNKANMTEVHITRANMPQTMWMCGCDTAQVQAFEAAN